MKHQFRSGDTVHHKPSGETWWVAWADSDSIFPAGWPETMADISDCELVRAGTDDDFHQMIKLCAESQSNRISTYRCRAYLENINKQECERITQC